MRKYIKILITLFIMISTIEIVAANPDPCPDPGNAWKNMATSNDVLVLQEDLGGNLTKYYAKSKINDNPSGGIPGFKEVCVVSITKPDSGSASWSILGKSWGAGVTNKNVVEFNGHASGADPGASGNEYNIPFDGAVHEVGTIQWNAVPQNIRTLVHIYSPEICARSTDNDDDNNPDTCFRSPPNPPPTVPELSTIVLTSAGLFGLVLISKKGKNKKGDKK